MSLRRRSFIFAGSAAFACIGTSASAEALIGLDRLWIGRGKEEINHRFLYEAGQALHVPAWKSYTWHWRDVRDGGEAMWIDPKLLILLAKMQTAVSEDLGYPARFELLSGYRTPEHNAMLEGAAASSQHLLGRAADITVPGLASAKLSEYAESAGASGIGTYPTKGYTHVDTGPPGRRWRK